MRPFVLDPLFRPLSTLAGIGPKNLKLYEKLLGGTKILDLLFHRPIDMVERVRPENIMTAPVDTSVILDVIIDKHTPAPRSGLPYRIRARDNSGFIDFVFFNGNGTWLEKQFPVNEKLTICGKVEEFRDTKQITHPDILFKTEDNTNIETREIIYPLTAGLTNKFLRKSVLTALETVPELPEWLNATHKQKSRWDDWKQSILNLQTPKIDADLNASSVSRSRLAYDELLANQLALSTVRNHQRKLSGRAFETHGKSKEKLISILPWKLTNAQNMVIAEIDADMASPDRMFRLLQGDVGSGKTIVAALAAMNAIDSGAQAAIMAPTEILARQHAETLAPLLDKMGIPFLTLTGRDKGKAREKILAQIADGSVRIVIGTHSLFQDTVEFHNLGLAVIDEQHRFGVHQRLQLSNKTKGTDVLVMTATPIPRTLTLTAYGDMDVSRITEKPAGRKPIDTRLIPTEKFEDMVESLKRQIADGARVYWVCPLVEESEFIDAAAAQERFEVLQHYFGDQVGILHGRMKPAEKDAAMELFISGKTKILVATTVIEVGVNVPEATIMIIEHAERFGLAQLHQLRGRVGRGDKASFCFLLYAKNLTETARERLQIMRQTEDGFIIAEKDLQSRGGGEILGTKQSGMPEFRLADLNVHSDLLLTARDDAKMIMAADPELLGDRGKALRTLLYLFERDQAISYLRAG